MENTLLITANLIFAASVRIWKEITKIEADVEEMKLVRYTWG